MPALTLPLGSDTVIVVARRALVTRLENMSRSARAIAHDHPGFAEAFQMPRPRSDENLVLASHAFLKSAEAARDRFVSYGIPREFIDGLKVLVDEFDDAMRSWQTGRVGQTAATTAITSAMAAADAAIRKLDIVVPTQLEEHPDALTAWKRERKVDVGRRRKIAAVTPEPAATTEKSSEAA